MKYPLLPLHRYLYVFHRTQQEMIGTFGLESCSYSLLDVSLIFTRGPVNALLLFKGK